LRKEGSMTGQKSSSSTTSPPPQVLPLPYALYESNGLLFELYNGGQRLKRHEVHWVRLEPTLTAAPPPAGGDCAKPKS
jgi:hypothetical protein